MDSFSRCLSTTSVNRLTVRGLRRPGRQLCCHMSKHSTLMMKHSMQRIITARFITSATPTMTSTLTKTPTMTWTYSKALVFEQRRLLINFVAMVSQTMLTSTCMADKSAEPNAASKAGN